MTTAKRRKPHPKGRPKPNARRPLPEPIALDWNDDQAIAVHHFCSALLELVWRQYEDVLIDATLQAQLQASSPLRDDRTRPLPFQDDDLAH